MNTPINPISTAPIIKALEQLYGRFDVEFFESTLQQINCIITISQKGRSNALGWCSREKIWQNGNDEKYYEINICPEFINRPIEEVCETLLHEMCHLYNSLNGIQDCSRNSQYHNKRFKECAEQHGLLVEKDSSRGFALTSLKPETFEYIKSLDLTAFDLYRNFNHKSEEKKKSSTRKYICPRCGGSVRVTKAMNLIHADCGATLILA